MTGGSLGAEENDETIRLREERDELLNQLTAEKRKQNELQGQVTRKNLQMIRERDVPGREIGGAHESAVTNMVAAVTSMTESFKGVLTDTLKSVVTNKRARDLDDDYNDHDARLKLQRAQLQEAEKKENQARLDGLERSRKELMAKEKEYADDRANELRQLNLERQRLASDRERAENERDLFRVHAIEDRKWEEQKIQDIFNRQEQVKQNEYVRQLNARALLQHQSTAIDIPIKPLLSRDIFNSSRDNFMSSSISSLDSASSHSSTSKIEELKLEKDILMLKLEMKRMENLSNEDEFV